jgi:hypothetical protein
VDQTKVRKERTTRDGTQDCFPFYNLTIKLNKGTNMKTQLKALAAAAVLITGIISSPAAYADQTKKSPGSTMGNQMQSGQMSPDMMKNNQNGMMGMMGMMMQMNQMMATCNTMMQSAMKNSGKPMPDGMMKKGAPGKKKEG